MAARPATAALALACLVAGALAPSAPARAGGALAWDGETLSLVDGRRVRLWGVDAPEPDQTCRRGAETYPCGLVAREVLGALVAGAELRCDGRGADRHGREVSQCWVDGRDLARELVRAGWALDDGRYSGGRYALPQRLAEEERIGLWAGEFLRPWDWRAGGR
jgi:endonuclease YncB( thermonuclease family)